MRVRDLQVGEEFCKILANVQNILFANANQLPLQDRLKHRVAHFGIKIVAKNCNQGKN